MKDIDHYLWLKFLTDQVIQMIKKKFNLFLYDRLRIYIHHVG